MKEAMSMGNILENGDYKFIKSRVTKLLQQEERILSVNTSRSTRAAGDAIQAVISKNAELIFDNIATKIDITGSRRAFADIIITDKFQNEYSIDVKTHRGNSKFHMPNITSVKRLAEYYKDPKHFFCLLIVKYDVDITDVKIEDVVFAAIENISKECFTLGNLGNGQIQLKNAKNLQIDYCYNRFIWMGDMCEKLLRFYPNEITKINKRIEYFEKIKRELEIKVQ